MDYWNEEYDGDVKLESSMMDEAFNLPNSATNRFHSSSDEKISTMQLHASFLPGNTTSQQKDEENQT